MSYKEVNGFYGSQNTRATILTAHNPNTGETQYCVEGSKMVNSTYEPVENGVNVEEINDVDCFTWSSEINTLDELEAAIEG